MTTSIKKIIEVTPGASIATIGLALSMYAYESQRMASFRLVEMPNIEMNLPSVFALLAFFLLTFLVYGMRPSFRLHRSAIIGFLIAGAYALSTIIIFQQALIPPSAQIDFIARVVLRICEILILLCWTESLIPLGAKRVALIYACSLLFLGILNIVTSFIKVDAVHLLVAFFPFISMACLYWFKAFKVSVESVYSLNHPRAFSSFKVDQSLMPVIYTKKNLIGLNMLFIIPMVLYSFVFGYIHFAWVPAQDGSFVSFSIQTAAALGTALAGIILILLISSFWGRRKLQLFCLFIPPLTLFALYVSSIVDGTQSFFYIIPLNIAQKLVFFLIWLSPFLIPSKKSPIFIWCLTLALYQTGKVFSITTSAAPEALFYTTSVAVAIVVLLIVVGIGIIIEKRPDGEPGKGNTNATADTAYHLLTTITNDLMSSNSSQEYCFDSMKVNSGKCHIVAHTFQLTRREEEVLQLLAEGMTAQAIAEALVVSTSTAKSHIRSIYAKLNIHTQNELLLMIHTDQQLL